MDQGRALTSWPGGPGRFFPMRYKLARVFTNFKTKRPNHIVVREYPRLGLLRGCGLGVVTTLTGWASYIVLIY